MNNSDNDKLLTVAEAAPMLGMAPFTLRRKLRDKDIPGVKVGTWKIKLSTVKAIQSGELVVGE